MTKEPPSSPRQLFAKTTRTGPKPDTSSLRVDEAMSSIAWVASSHADLANDHARLKTQAQAFQDEFRALTSKNAECIGKLAEAHKVITVLSQRIGLFQEQIAETNAKLLLSQRMCDEQGAQLERLLNAIEHLASGKTQDAEAPSFTLLGRQAGSR